MWLAQCSPLCTLCQPWSPARIGPRIGVVEANSTQSTSRVLDQSWSCTPRKNVLGMTRRIKKRQWEGHHVHQAGFVCVDRVVIGTFRYGSLSDSGEDLMEPPLSERDHQSVTATPIPRTFQLSHQSGSSTKYIDCHEFITVLKRAHEFSR